MKKLIVILIIAWIGLGTLQVVLPEQLKPQSWFAPPTWPTSIPPVRGTATARAERANAAVNAQETRMVSRATATRTSLDKHIQDIKDGTPFPTPTPTRARPTRTPITDTQAGQTLLYNARRTPITNAQAMADPQEPFYTDRDWEVCDLVGNTGFMDEFTAEVQAVSLNMEALASLSIGYPLEAGDRPEILRLARDTRVPLDRIESLFRNDFMNFPEAVDGKLGLFSDLVLELVELTQRQMDDLILLASNEDYIALARIEDRDLEIAWYAEQMQYSWEVNCPGY